MTVNLKITPAEKPFGWCVDTGTSCRFFERWSEVTQYVLDYLRGM